MIGYVTIGTDNPQELAKFYDALFAEIGGKRFLEMDHFVAWNISPTQPAFGVIQPHDGQPASRGNGTMVAFTLSSDEDVSRMHEKALELGASDEGAPGSRGGNFFGAYARDPEGNKFCLFHISQG